ncbi:GNAT family N-acetyltransferase [Ruminococcaceae bacterium OttesenSCG-928-O06]|nr:GNAT family N-acetyltransferase [Ruminococcaceae bacterium OttesenSCG-928-O06]
MLTIQKMAKSDVPVLYEIALRAFRPDFEKYGVYPPLLKQKQKTFLPPRIFGKTVWVGDAIVGGAFVLATGKKGEIGAIFIAPEVQNKGYGREAMLAIEQMYPKVEKWKLETPGESYHLHRFYESLGYVKAGEIQDPKSGMTGFVYEKTV